VFSGHGYGAGDLKTYLGNEKPKNTGEIQRQKYVFSDWEHLFARTKYKIKHCVNKNMGSINFSTIFKYKNVSTIILSHYNAQQNLSFDSKRKA